MHVRIIRGKFVTADWTASFDDSFNGRERASSLSRHSPVRSLLFIFFYFFFFSFILSSLPPTRNFRATRRYSFPFLRLRTQTEGKNWFAQGSRGFPSRISFLRKSLNDNSRIDSLHELAEKFIFPPPPPPPWTARTSRWNFPWTREKNGDEFFNRKFGGERGFVRFFEKRAQKWIPHVRDWKSLIVKSVNDAKKSFLSWFPWRVGNAEERRGLEFSSITKRTRVWNHAYRYHRSRRSD